jgi:uncharacterized 2Fe-2S/4Fe-4S cluster protein (DUF4445 family)
VFSAAAACDLIVDHPCGGTASCGRCRVRVSSGSAVPVTESDRAVFDAVAIDGGWRLGCRLVLAHDACVELGAPAVSARAKSFGPQDLAIGEGREPIPVPAGAAPLGLAVDIGTTTLAAALVDLDSGHVLASRTQLNPQIGMGADVMSRIARANESVETRLAMTRAVRAAIAEMAARLAEESDTRPGEIGAVAIVGNPTMRHLWRGCDVAPLGMAPYHGTEYAAEAVAARTVDCPVHPEALVYWLPGLRAHVGADALGAAAAAGVDTTSGAALLLDLGTNSEVVLHARGRTFAASTAAGPAFEGRTLSCGMRAEDGAIDAVRIAADGHVVTRSIGHAAPRGVCGSGLMDSVAELRRIGVLDARGRFRPAADLAADLPPAVNARLVEGPWGRGFRLAGDGETAVVLRAADVRQLQLAAASVRAGIAVMLEEAGVAAMDLDAVYVAGNFGFFARKTSLAVLGLIPEVPLERVQLVGNTAGVAARLALVDHRFRRRVEAMAAAAYFVDLGGRPAYAEAFMSALATPFVELV